MLRQVDLIKQDIETIKESLNSLSSMEPCSSTRFDRSTGRFYSSDEIAIKVRLNPQRMWGRIVTKIVVTYQDNPTWDEGVKILGRFAEGVQEHIQQAFQNFKFDQASKNDLLEHYKILISFGNITRVHLKGFSQDSSVEILYQMTQKIEAFITSQKVTCSSIGEDDLASLSRSSSGTLEGSDCGSIESFE